MINNCYNCEELKGSIINSYGQTVAICMPVRIKNAPPMDIGCEKHRQGGN